MLKFSDMPPVLLHPSSVKPSWQLLTIKRFIVWHASVKCAQDYIKKKEKKEKKEKNRSLRGDQFSSVTHSCPTLCYPMNRSKPGLPVHHQVPWVTQTHVHWVGDTIHPSHPLTSPSPPALNRFQQQDAFKWASSSDQVTKVLEFQLQQSFQWTLRTDFL